MKKTERRDGFFGRRKGKRLRPAQARLLEALLPRLSLDLSRAPPDDLRSLFRRSVLSVRMEIGFGSGEHLIEEARRNPSIGYIGIEPFLNGMAKALSAIEALGLETIRLHHGEAGDVVDWAPASSLEEVCILYPDPWPKRRHHKRRLVSAEMLDRLARPMQSGGILRFATDIDDYAAWTLRHVFAHRDFEWPAERAGDWRGPWAGWTGTRYEAKALREGRRPVYLAFRRL